MPKVSIIIPVYNSALYLRKCINSVLAQTLTGIELILVDDGSTDGSELICDAYKTDSRVRVIHQNNKGVSSARNTGMNVATGEYIGFVDSDDYIAKEMYSTLYTACKNNSADIALCDFEECKENDSLISDISKLRNGNEIFNKQQITDVIRTANRKKILWFSWRYLYKRSFLNDHMIRFPETLQLGEETPVNLECLLCTDRQVVHVHKKLYYYVRRNDSATTKKYNDQYWKKLESLYFAKISVYKKHHFEGYEDDLNWYTINHIIPLILSNEIKNKKQTLRQIKYFKEVRNCLMVREAFRSEIRYENKSKMKWLLRLFRYRMFVFLTLLCR